MMPTMASMPKQQNRMMKERTPRFFKIILEKTIREGKLGMPKKFVREYGKNLPCTVLLKVFDGSGWRVELAKSDGKIFLQKGWREFVGHFGLAHGHLLVFEYHQKSCDFSVMIFDESALEIDYPLSNNNIMINGDNSLDLGEEFQAPKIEKAGDDGNTAETLNDAFPCRKPKGKLLLPFSKPCKMMKVEDFTLHRSITRAVEEKKDNGIMSCRRQTSVSDGIVTRRHRLNFKEKRRALDRVRAEFKSENPYFMVVMQPSYVSSEYDKFTIPGSFAEKHLKEIRGNAFLNGLDGRSWPVKYYLYTSEKRRFKKTTAKITDGWRVFARNNELEVGDVCAFELIEGIKTTFEVTIFTCNKGKNKQLTGEGSTSKDLIQNPLCCLTKGSVLKEIESGLSRQND